MRGWCQVLIQILHAMADHHVWHPWQWLYHVISRLENEWNAWKMVGILSKNTIGFGKAREWLR
jgi:cobalamin biosynthesis protein CobD/CbiB